MALPAAMRSRCWLLLNLARSFSFSDRCSVRIRPVSSSFYIKCVSDDNLRLLPPRTTLNASSITTLNFFCRRSSCSFGKCQQDPHITTHKHNHTFSCSATCAAFRFASRSCFARSLSISLLLNSSTSAREFIAGG